MSRWQWLCVCLMGSVSVSLAQVVPERVTQPIHLRGYVFSMLGLGFCWPQLLDDQLRSQLSLRIDVFAQDFQQLPKLDFGREALAVQDSVDLIANDPGIHNVQPPLAGRLAFLYTNEYYEG